MPTPAARRISDAVRANDPHGVARAVEAGVALDVRDPDGRTPLHLAAAVNAVEAARALLDRGADPNALDRFGVAPLFRAVFDDHVAMVELLRAHGAHVLFRGSMNFPRVPPIQGCGAGLVQQFAGLDGSDLEDTVLM